MFKCDKNNAVERAQRVKRQPMDPPIPPRPCVNGTMAGSANDEEESGAGATMGSDSVSDGMEEKSGVGDEEEQREQDKKKRKEKKQNRRNKD